MTDRPPAYRGHLFSDLRGYTSFVERAGNAAGAELIDDYRKLVRDCVAEHGGAEVKTEGDAFYLVFPSASSAVLCGLAIVEGAAAATAARPERPISVGVGVHAGEVIETDDTYIGTAVNVAARVCAVARPGEVLATATVRGVTQGSIPVSFTARGRKRLKGLADPVELFVVTEPGAEPATPPVTRRTMGLLGGVAALAAVAVFAIVALNLGGLPTDVTADPTAPAGQPLAIGPLALGAYRADQFVPPFDFVVDDPGWEASRTGADEVRLVRTSDPTGELYFARLEAVHTDACLPGSVILLEDFPASEVINAIKGVEYVEPADEREVKVNDREGVAVDFTISAGVFAACSGDQVKVFKIGDEDWQVPPGQRVSVRAIDVDGETVAMLLTSSDPTGSVLANEAFVEKAERIVGSIDF